MKHSCNAHDVRNELILFMEIMSLETKNGQIESEA